MLHVQLKQFDGPLDLLLYLVGKAKVDIRDIFVSEITEQYVLSVQSAPDLDMDSASEFIALAATLIEIKSRAILPNPPREDEEDSQQALIRRLEEYQLFKAISASLARMEAEAARCFPKLPEEFPLPPQTFEWEGLSLDALMEALKGVLARRERTPATAAVQLRDIRRDGYTVPACVSLILRRLRRGEVRFTELFSDDPGREEVVTLFLAMLELLRLGKAHMAQARAFGDIALLPGRRSARADAAS